MDAERMAAMLEEANYTVGHDTRAIREDAHRENAVVLQSSQRQQRLTRPFSKMVQAQQEKNKRDRQLREHFSREKRAEQQRFDKQGVAYDRTMVSALGPTSQQKPTKHAKKASNAFTRLVRPLSTALLYSTAAPPAPTRKWTLAELDFTPNSKPALAINLGSARARSWPNKARSFVFTVDTEDGGRIFLQATNHVEMNRWIEMILKTATSTAEKRRTYLGPPIALPEIAPRPKDMGKHPTAGDSTLPLKIG